MKRGLNQSGVLSRVFNISLLGGVISQGCLAYADGEMVIVRSLGKGTNDLKLLTSEVDFAINTQMTKYMITTGNKNISKHMKETFEITLLKEHTI